MAEVEGFQVGQRSKDRCTAKTLKEQNLKGQNLKGNGKGNNVDI